MTVRVLTTCHTQYTWDSSICVFVFNRTTLQVFVTYLTGALYVHPLWFYKHQHNNRVRSKLFVACQRWWFQLQFWFVPSVPGYLQEEEEHKPDPWRNPIERNHMGLHLECIVYDTDNHFLITPYIIITSTEVSSMLTMKSKYPFIPFCGSKFRRTAPVSLLTRNGGLWTFSSPSVRVSWILPIW